ncbi:uncharacterized protein N7458_011268 [Penicillium daleae]|uniref:Major facilitator superfamily (MFS) profile domain-containing protein n=1 Tax=Penicillium daleae TaxID=63821 RepID=A0AAD6BRM6_9EURO|nr:uncharacterized protein N7458_011268 [Penicillium daleae]KAJ5432112.1 hypothetical protein N7458_011268 [Penicillium daleae]
MNGKGVILSYDCSLMGSINVMTEYQNYYNLGSTGSASTGIVLSIFQLGQMVGALFAWVNDWRGRKVMILFGCTAVVAFSIFTATAPTLGSFIGVRFLLSFFSTLASVAAPVLLVELAPPLLRGSVAGGYNTLYYMGSIVATFGNISCLLIIITILLAIYGCNLHLHRNINWHLPLWLQTVCPSIVVLFGYWMPESPRWLIAKGRREEARRFLIKHHTNGDENRPIVALEMAEIEESLSHGGIRSARDYFNIKALFSTRARRYRIMLVVAWSWFGQFSGNNYLPTVITAVGITSVSTLQLLNGIYAVTGWIAASIGARCHDVVGRRKMFTGSCASMGVCLAIITGVMAKYQHDNSDTNASSAMIAFIFIFGVVFDVVRVGPPAHTVMPLISKNTICVQMVRWCPRSLLAAQDLSTHLLPPGRAEHIILVESKIAFPEIHIIYAFFVLWDCFEFVFVYVVFMETKGRTLELEVVFESNSPREASTRKMVPNDAAVLE